MLDGLETIKICTGYRMDGELHDTPPLRVERYAECQPVYEEMPGWTTSTVGVTALEALPAAARRYLSRIEEILGVPLHLVSTGPGRDENIVIRHPFD